MNKLVYSSLVLTLVSTPGFATEWASLDQEINNLNASLTAQNATGPKLGGWVRSRFFDASNDVGDDAQGFSFDAVRLEISGDAGSNYGYKVSFDFADGLDVDGDDLSDGNFATLKDAYVTFKLGDMATGKMGQFKPNFLRSATVSQNRLVLLDRTLLGQVFSERDLGLEISGSFETIGWSLSGQNGLDELADDYTFCAKISADLMGGGVGKTEGAYGANDGTALYVGAAYLKLDDEANAIDETAIAVEAALTMGGFSAAAELVDFDELGLTPWDVTGSYLFTQNWEAAVRYQDLDELAETTVMTAGLNYYVSGHDIKWTLQYDTTDSDDASVELDAISLGLGVSF